MSKCLQDLQQSYPILHFSILHTSHTLFSPPGKILQEIPVENKEQFLAYLELS